MPNEQHVIEGSVMNPTPMTHGIDMAALDRGTQTLRLDDMPKCIEVKNLNCITVPNRP